MLAGAGRTGNSGGSDVAGAKGQPGSYLTSRRKRLFRISVNWLPKRGGPINNELRRQNIKDCSYVTRFSVADNPFRPPLREVGTKCAGRTGQMEPVKVSVRRGERPVKQWLNAANEKTWARGWQGS